jgi:hypothetical protein
MEFQGRRLTVWEPSFIRRARWAVTACPGGCGARGRSRCAFGRLASFPLPSEKHVV